MNLKPDQTCFGIELGESLEGDPLPIQDAIAVLEVAKDGYHACQPPNSVLWRTWPRSGEDYIPNLSV